MTTPNLGLPEVPSNSLQPSVPINDALQVLDAITQLVVQDKDLSAPPVTVAEDAGKVWIVGAAATGAWAAHEAQLALCVGADLWRFIVPKPGWRGYVLDESADYRYTGTAWVLLT